MGAIKMIVAARTDVGRARTNNEDAFAITDLATGTRLEGEAIAGAIDVRAKGVLLALSDGMGGHEAGEVASALVLESLRDALESTTASGGFTIEEKIEAAVKRANADVARAARDQSRRGMGATLTAVFAQGQEAYVAEVGDSRAYLLRGGRLRQITRDQSLVQILVDSGVISAEEAKTSPHKNVVLQAMGLGDDVRVAIGRLSLRRGDIIFLCSDGVSNLLSDDDMRDVLLGAEPADSCKRLIEIANERGGEDNETAIVARFDGPGLIAPKRTESVTATFQVIREYEAIPQGGSASADDDDDTDAPAGTADPAPATPTKAATGAAIEVAPSVVRPAGEGTAREAPSVGVAERGGGLIRPLIVVVVLLVAAALLLTILFVQN